MTAVYWLDGIAQAELIRTKKISAVELIQETEKRITALNPKLNAVIRTRYEDARAEAAGDLPLSALSGVPMLLKDLVVEQAGVALSEGSAFLNTEFVPTHNSELLNRYKRAGLIAIGKTNTPEYGLQGTTEPDFFGPTKNPWDLTRSPGGSSGGSAAAVAAGLVAIGHANDGGGSIRIPAANCGLFGMKPSRGRNPMGPAYGDLVSGLISEHVVTRSVRDSAAVLDLTGRPDRGDPYRAPPKDGFYLEEIFAQPGQMRITFSTNSPMGRDVDADCKAAVRHAADLCADLGHEVIEMDLPVDADRIFKLFGVFWQSLAAWTIDYWSSVIKKEPKASDFEAMTWEMYQRGKRISASEYLMAVTDAQVITREVGAFFRKNQTWMSPTLAEPPLPLGSFQPVEGDPMMGAKVGSRIAPFTPIFNLIGHPAMSMPLYWNDAGLPIGIQIAGRPGGEAALFRLAAQLERAQPWAHRYPELAA